VDYAAAVRTLLAALIALCVIFALGEQRYRGAPVVGANAAADAVSAERARASLARVLGDDGPHATGTASLQRVRARLAESLRELGYAPEERSMLSCGRYGACARVHRVIVRHAGTASSGSVLLLAHLDAVGASPGASDDGAGVACGLEIARALRASGPLRNDVLILFVEGEELGLLGAEAFVREDPIAREVRAVINLEARGTRDAASLFQLSRGGGVLVDVAGRQGSRPVGSSLFSTIYERMPNDTDLTVFLERGYLGMNYAFTGGVEHYHTARDDVKNQDPRSVQHLCDRAFASVRALGDYDLHAPARYELVWFDVLAFAVVRYPVAAALPIALAALSALLLASVLAVRARRATIGELGIGAVAWLATIVVGAVAALGVVIAIRSAGGMPTPWIAHPSPMLFALVALAIVATVAPVWLARRVLSAEGYALAIWIMHALVGVALSATLPGASYLFVVPALVAGVVALLACVRQLQIHRDVAIALPALCAAIVWVVVVRGLYPALGGIAAPGVTVTLAMVLLPLAPLLLALPRVILARSSALLALFAVVATVVACVVRPFSKEVPRRVNVLYAIDESRIARVGVDPSWAGTPWGDVPAEMRRALGASARDAVLTPWREDTIVVGEAAPIDVPLPTAEPVPGDSGAQRVRMRLRSRRGAPTLLLIARPGSTLSSVEVIGATGSATFFERGLSRGARGIRFDGIGGEGVEVICAFSGSPSELFLADATYGVPPAVQPIVDARPADAVASQDGDLTIAYRRVQP